MPRAHHSLTSSGAHLVLFGGTVNSQVNSALNEGERLGVVRPMVPGVSARFARAGILDDLWTFDSNGMAWTKLSPRGPRPKSRINSGIASDGSGTVYLFGGWGEAGGGSDWGGTEYSPCLHDEHRGCFLRACKMYAVPY